MAYGVVHHFKGGSQAQFDAVAAVVDPPDGSLLPGESFEASGPSADGWVVMAVFDSKERWETFLQEKLLPAMGELGASGFAGPPEEWAFEVVNLKR
jgi:hypothetical protein